jgi:protein required for attachment to host cells
MKSIPGLYFIMVWPDRARFVRPDPEDRLHTVGSVTRETLQNHADPDHQPTSVQTSFLTLLAKRIGEDLSVDLFTHFVLVAPPVTLKELVGLLDAPTTASLLGTLARDLMAVPDLELWPHLLPWIQPGKTDHTTPVSTDN